MWGGKDEALNSYGLISGLYYVLSFIQYVGRQHLKTLAWTANCIYIYVWVCVKNLCISYNNDKVNNYDMWGLMDRIGYVLVILKSY